MIETNLFPVQEQTIQLPISGQEITICHLEAPLSSTLTNPLWSRVWSTSILTADVLLQWNRERELPPEKVVVDAEDSSREKQRVLEIGAGSGVVSTAAAMSGALVTVTDFSVEALTLAKQTAERNRVHFDQVYRWNWHDPWSGPRFDLVVASDVLYMQSSVRCVARMFWDTLRQEDDMSGKDSFGLLVDPGRCYGEEFLEHCQGELGNMMLAFIFVSALGFATIQSFQFQGLVICDTVALKKCLVVLLSHQKTSPSLEEIKQVLVSSVSSRQETFSNDFTFSYCVVEKKSE